MEEMVPAEAAPAGTPPGAWRVLFPRRSVLRRRSDRIELFARWTAVLLVLLLIPVVLAVGSMVADDAEARGAVARATRHAVVATVVVTPEVRARDARTDQPRGTRVLPVTWTGRDGVEHRGHAPVGRDAVLGGTSLIWVDDADDLAQSPPAPGDGARAGAAVAFILLILVLLVVVVGFRLVCLLLDHGRLRAWGREWETIGRLGRGRAR